jgi:hypothetical protein
VHVVNLCHTISDVTELGSLIRAVRVQVRECVEPEFPTVPGNLVDMRASVGDNSPVEAYSDFYNIARKGLLRLLLVETELETYRNFRPCSGVDEALRVSMGGDADRDGIECVGTDVGVKFIYAADTDVDIGYGSN